MTNLVSLLTIVCDADMRRQATVAHLCEHVTINMLLRMYALLERLAVRHV